MILEEIIERLKEYAEVFRLNEYKGTRSLYMKFNISHGGYIRENISKILGEHIRDGEIIEMSIRSGLFIDMGMETVRIRRGFIWEYYHYPKTIHYYIRLLYLTNAEDWIALYIDENPLTAWWSDKERK